MKKQQFLVGCFVRPKAEKQLLLGGGLSELRLKGFALEGPQVFNWDLQFL